MANFLEITCPRCGDGSQIDIAATLWVRVTKHGTDADASEDGTVEYTPESTAQCIGCGYCGRLDSFNEEAGEQQP